MRKLFFLFVSLVATTTLWAYDFQSGDLYYNITSETTVEVTNGDYSALTVATIPETIIYNDTTYSVTSIGDDAFAWCSNLTSITIPNSVTSIGGGAFFLCESLTSITIPNSVMSIGDAAFRECYNLTSVTIGNSVTSIGEMAFEDCWSLTSITIPNSVTSIGWAAFRGCYHITSITIPNSVTSIGDYAFQRCSDFTSMIVESGNSTYDSRENCDAIIETATNTLIAGCQNTIIPNSVTSIREYAFQNCSDLTSITIPNSVTSIGDAAFNCCSYLTSITIPNSVTSIGGEAFVGCWSLTSVIVESGNSTYDSRENCNAIIETTTNTLVAGCKNTIIPNSVTSIGNSAFNRCDALTSVTIPNSVVSIGRQAFAWCSSLKTVICEAIEVPELLGGYVFYYMPLSEATLYVPAQSLDDYKAADQWKDFGTILPIEEEEPEEEIKLQDMDMTIVFINSEDNDSDIYRETIIIKVPTAPTIAGFTFLYWQPVAEPITNEITIQAIYEADTPTSAEVYTNPANPAQKLLRNGQVYILQDGKTYTIMGQEL